MEDVPLSDIWELDTEYWGASLTPRQVADHMRLTGQVDPSHPVILGVDGRVMDGMHRIVRALLDGRRSIPAVRFTVLPDPDFVDCDPSELPYPD